MARSRSTGGAGHAESSSALNNSASGGSSTSNAASTSSSSPSTSSTSHKYDVTNPPPGTTIWTAPQSFQNPTAPREPAQPHLVREHGAEGAALSAEAGQAAWSRRRQETYFRRITGSHPPGTSPRTAPPPTASVGTAPNLRTRLSIISTFVLGIGLGGYMVLFADFGDREHVFSPLRRLVLGSMLNITPEQEAWLKRGFKTRHVPPSSTTSESLPTTAEGSPAR